MLDDIVFALTFALPNQQVRKLHKIDACLVIRKIGLDYVSKNQNKTTILRSQPGR